VIFLDFIFTKPKLSDAKEAMEYINEFVDEKAFIATQTKKTLKEEKMWISEILKKMKKGDAYGTFVRSKGTNELIGIGTIERRAPDTTKHIATIGISVRTKYRNVGIGTTLLNKLVSEGKKLKGIEIIHLGVYSLNKRAIRFYERNGFKEVCRFPKWVKIQGNYCDGIEMQYIGK
jgi:RimJ/RimL family protein N-acetyltransferase